MELDLTKTTHLFEDDLKFLREKIKYKSNDADRVHEYILGSEGNRKVEVFNVLENPPKFLFENQATNTELYNFLKHDPKSVRFFYKTYTENKTFLEKLCDPSYPLYLSEVEEELKLPIKARNMDEEIRSLSSFIQSKTYEKNTLIESLNELDKEYSTLEGKVKEKKIEIETLETQIMNLHGKEGLMKITDYLKQVQTFIRRVYEDRDNQDPMRLSGVKGLFSIDKEKFRSLLDDSEKLELYLKADEFTKEDIENSKTELAKVKEEIIQAREQALRELEITRYMKISEKLKKLSQGALFNLNFVKDRQQRNDPEYKLFGYNGLMENMVDILNTTGDLITQIELAKKAQGENK